MEPRAHAYQVDYEHNVTCITVRGLLSHADLIPGVFKALATRDINVDVIIANMKADGSWDLSFTVAGEDADHTWEAVRQLIPSRDVGALSTKGGLGKVSLVGSAMRDTPGYAAEMFRALAEEDINIEMITTADIRITCVIRTERVMDAVRALRRAFRLEQ